MNQSLLQLPASLCFRTVRSRLRPSWTLRGQRLRLLARLVRRALQSEAMRPSLQRARTMQEWHVSMRHRMERKTLHDGGMSEFLFRPWTVQGVE